MRKRFCMILLALALLVSGCAGKAEEEEEGVLHILASTYPAYLFTTAVTEGVQEVRVELLVREKISCLHDYTLTIAGMKAVEGADVIVINGAGLEDFMSGALSQSAAAVIDCSEGIDLLDAPEEEGHKGHGQEEEVDPHIWMDEANAVKMLDAIRQGLEVLDPAHADAYEANFQRTAAALAEAPERVESRCKYLITFHDGFQYFARRNGLHLLKAVEEEEGAEPSAAEIKEIVGLIQEYDIPAIFTEKNGSSATAKAIQRETGCGVYPLDMLMSGSGTGIGPYLDAMQTNRDVILEALG